MRKKSKRKNLLLFLLFGLCVFLIVGSISITLLLSQLSLWGISDQFRSTGDNLRQSSKEKKTLTIFTTVLEAKDDPQRYLAQENCLALLSELPSTYVIVFTDSREWIKKSRSYGLFAVNNVASNEFGTPYLKAMFQYAFDHCNSEFYGYVNADILLDTTIIDSLNAISRDIASGEMKGRTYIVGQRTNVQQELEDQFIKGGKETAMDFVTRMLLKGHRYWDSAVDYHIVRRDTFDWESIPDFVIGRAGYDIYLVETAYLDPDIIMVDLTNTVHCAHMLSKDGNRSGIKRKTPDKDWNKDLLAELPGGCCTYKSFGKLSNRHSVLIGKSICLAHHGFEGYYDDSYYDTEKEFIKTVMENKTAGNCLLISENDVLGLLLPYCKSLTIIIMNTDACERTLDRLTRCGESVQIGCNRKKLSPRELVLSMFQKIDTDFDLVVVQSEKPLIMINWIQHRLVQNGVLIMRRWLDPVERKEIEKALGNDFKLLGTYPFKEAPPEFDKTHDEHFGMAGFQKIHM